jgi:hypothetical protein
MDVVGYKENNLKIMIGFKKRKKFIYLHKLKKYLKIKSRSILDFLSLII